MNGQNSLSQSHRQLNVCCCHYPTQHRHCRFCPLSVSPQPRQSSLGTSQVCPSLPQQHQAPFTHLWKQTSQRDRIYRCDGASQEYHQAISGFVFLIGGAAVSLALHKQELITLSTAEAKYIATTHAAKDCIWLQRLIEPFLGPSTALTILFCNNQAVLHLATDDNYHTHTKHINIQYHFICQTIHDRHINMEYCPTEEMTTDILTKALSSKSQFIC